MYARALDDAGARLRELRREEREDLGLALVALALALAATQARPVLAMPLFLGGVGVGLLGVRALWRRWDLVDRLAADRDAYVIEEVKAYASREATPERRRRLAGAIRRMLDSSVPAACRPDVAAELRSLAADLDDERLELDAASAVECLRLLRDPDESPLLDPLGSPDDLRDRVRHIRTGFRARRRGGEGDP
ncbi:MAG TPA: hypothetical protein VFM41_11015 [Gaiella sp.]|nr:hypothetical protein [Gaiella sp.]